jgi:hypothetical protein
MILFKNKQHQSAQAAFSRRMFSEFNRSMMLIADRDLLVTNISLKIMQIIPVNRIAVFLLNSETGVRF